MSHQNAADREAQAGFSLIEVLTALVIASIALVALLRGLGSSQVSAIYLESHLGARILARSIIEDERQATGTKTGQRAGDSGQYHWTLDVEPGDVDGIGKPENGYRLYRLTATISWTPRGRLVLDTLKFGK